MGFPIVSGIIISLVSLPIYSRRDYTYVSKYWSDSRDDHVAMNSFCGNSSDTKVAYVDICLDLLLLIGAALALSLSSCTNVATCANPWLVKVAVAFFGLCNGILLVATLKLLILAQQSDSEESIADANRLTRKAVMIVIK